MPANHPRVISLRKYRLLIDRAVIYEWGRKLEGRFWGVVAVLGLCAGISICFAINPHVFTLSGAISDFGDSIRTSPYFSGSLFFASYGLWRWRNYVSHSLRHQTGIGILFSLTIMSLGLVALMPYGWHPWAYGIHMIAVSVLGLSIVATVVVDGLLTKPERAVHTTWRVLRALAFYMIVAGCFIIFSSTVTDWLSLTLLGEMLLLGGYSLWVVMKTFAKVDKPSKFASLLNNLVIIE